MMTIHVLHAGDGYLYLTRSVAAHDAQLKPGESLTSYYVVSGQPQGRWMGRGAANLNVSGVVTEEQMRLLFGEGRHPSAELVEQAMLAAGATSDEAASSTRLGRRFPHYTPRVDLVAELRRGYRQREQELGRPMTDHERTAARQQIAAAAFERQHGRAPLDPVELEAFVTTASQSRRDAVAGYDLVFTPVKSVTALWGIGSDETRRQIFAAHETAVADALAWLEANAAYTRTGSSGQAQIDTLGLTAAAFHHWDSRAGDPDLHTHVAVSNKVQGPDGKWRSIDGRVLFAAAVSVSERYNTRIEDELRTRLGIGFTERWTGDDSRRPVREIDGFPVELIEAFSKRRQGIEQIYAQLLVAYRAEHGHEPAAPARHRLYQQATLAERPDKQRGRTLRAMVDAWQAEADTALGRPDAGAWVENQVCHRDRATSRGSVEAIADRTVEALSASRATWTEHHVRAEAHRQSRPISTSDRDRLVEAIVAAACHPSRSVRIQTPRSVAEPAELQRRDGESVFVDHASARFTTTAILDAEDRIVTAARCRTSHRLDRSQVAEALGSDDGRRLNPGQARLLRAFTAADKAVLLGIAPAGAGKTTTMRAAVTAWRGSGRLVVALAPSAVAADVLGTELGIDADTLAKFDHDEPPILPGTMILIDEAGMVGTLALDRIVLRAQAADAVVRLLGDDQQLAAIEAGGVIRHLATEVGAVRMDQVVRFADPAEADATLRVRGGDPTAADFYLARRRVVAGTSSTAPDAAYDAWLAEVRRGRDTILLARDTDQVADLNARARADLVLAGQVQVDGVTLRDGNVAAVGDQVATRRNNRWLAVHGGRDWVKNGDGWRVLAVHDDGALTVEHRRHHGRTTLDPDYVAAHVELDYARSIRRAQGLTVDSAHLVVDPRMAREELYVGLSRARHGTRLYVTVMTEPDPDHLPDVAGSARDVLTSVIGRTAVEPSANEAIKEAVTAIGDLRRMAVEYEHALGVQVGDRYTTAAEQAHPGICADPAWPAVAQRLHLGEAHGMAPEQLLDQADRLGEFTEARSIAQILVYRLDLLLHRLDTQQPDTPSVPSWLATAPPAGLAEPWDSYLPQRYHDMAARIDQLADQTGRDRPTWLDRLGTEPTARIEAIRQVVSYRAVYAHTDDTDPIGPEPRTGGRQQHAWKAAEAAIDATHQAPAQSNAERILAGLERTTRIDSDDPPTATLGGPHRHL